MGFTPYKVCPAFTGLIRGGGNFKGRGGPLAMTTHMIRIEYAQTALLIQHQKLGTRRAYSIIYLYRHRPRLSWFIQPRVSEARLYITGCVRHRSYNEKSDPGICLWRTVFYRKKRLENKSLRGISPFGSVYVGTSWIFCIETMFFHSPQCKKEKTKQNPQGIMLL